MRSAEEVWKQAMNTVKKEMSTPIYETWLAAIKPLTIENDTLHVSVMNGFAKDSLESRSVELIENALSKACSRSLSIRFSVSAEHVSHSAISAASMNWSGLKDEAVSFVMEAARKITDVEREALHIDTKQDADDLVTDKDIEVQRILTERIHASFPDHRIIGEEGDDNLIEEDDRVTWIIDPIDGTTNFVHQAMNYAVSIGIYQAGTGYVGIIYDIKRNEWFTAVRGQGAYVNGSRLPKRKSVKFEQAIIGFNARWLVGRADPQMKEAFANIVREVRAVRSYGSAALESAYVAAGRLDAYVSLRLSPWDFAGAAVLLEETGSTFSQLDGSAINLNGECTFLAADEQVQKRFLEYLNKP